MAKIKKVFKYKVEHKKRRKSKRKKQIFGYLCLFVMILFPTLYSFLNLDFNFFVITFVVEIIFGTLYLISLTNFAVDVTFKKMNDSVCYAVDNHNGVYRIKYSLEGSSFRHGARLLNNDIISFLATVTDINSIKVDENNSKISKIINVYSIKEKKNKVKLVVDLENASNGTIEANRTINIYKNIDNYNELVSYFKVNSEKKVLPIVNISKLNLIKRLSDTMAENATYDQNKETVILSAIATVIFVIFLFLIPVNTANLLDEFLARFILFSLLYYFNCTIRANSNELMSSKENKFNYKEFSMVLTYIFIFSIMVYIINFIIQFFK